MLTSTVNDEARESASRLDGCYVLKTDLSSNRATTCEVHDRYKDLSQVEHAFRTMKLDFLNMRPLFLRNESRTRGHLLVVMLSYAIARELRLLWSQLDCKVSEGIAELTTLTLQRYFFRKHLRR